VDGQCSGPDHEACATNGSGVCADIDTCSIDVGTKCTAPGTYDPAECPDKMGHCSLAISPPEACVNGSHTCLDLGVCDGTVNQQCHGDGDCHDVPGGCAGDGQSCNFALNNCPDVGTCTLDGNHCHSSGINLLECPDLDGSCDSEGQRCNNTLGPACPMTTGHCGGPGGAVCTDSPNTCPNNGMTCQGGPTHNPCTTATAATDCPTLGGSCDGGYGTCNFGTDPPSCPFIHNHGMCHDGINRCDKPDGSDCPQISTSGPVACSDLVLGSTTMSIPVPNGDFEAPLVDTSTHDYSFDFTGAAWSSLGGAFFVRRPAVTRPGVDVDVPIGIQGAQAVGIQGVPPGGSPGSIYQAINIPAGSYRLSFLAAQRDCCDPGPNPVIVSVDGVPLGSPITPTPDFNVNSYSVQFAIANGGGPLHTIAFTGTVGGDRSTFIDAVTITSGKSLLEDANSDGAVCRHNNQNYADGTTAVRFNYPDATYNLPVFAGTGPNACVPSPRYTTVARHYWKTSVEWCIDFEGHDDAKWQGYGSTRCQDDQDETHIYPRFYQFDQPAGTDNVATPAMQRMDLDATVNPTFDHGLDELGDPIHRNFGGGTPDVSEMVNYANWFAYYRTRILAVKTVTSLSFNELDGKSRVGLHTMFADLMPVHPNPIVYPTFLNVAQFDNSTAAQLRDLWFNTMFGITVPLGHETPTLDSMVRIGQYYMTGHSTGLPTAADPIVLSCSKNFHLLFTDGYTNQQGIPTEIPPVNDQDNTITTYPNIGAHPIPGLVAGGAWPHPYQEDVVHGPADNSLSDYAMYYWVTDLYHGSGGPNRFNVVASDSDPATWLHQNFAAVSLGTTGKLAAGSATESGLAAGTVQWPQPQDSLGHVNVFQPDNSGVDDLWHAAVNGRGQFVNAQSVDELKLGIGQVLADVAAQSGARIGAGFQSVNYSLAGGTNVYYRVTFEPGWAGSLTKVVYDPNLPPATAVEQWKAETQLTAKLLVVNPGDTPWLTNRRIVTVNESGTAVPFLWANLGAHQQDSLWPPAVFSKVQREKWVVDYLRGDSEREGSKLGQFRKRSGPLGDIVDSSPVYVGPKPNAPYRDTDDPGYSAFAASTTRGARVYVAANDGMVHAFDDGNGNETWAYIPSQLYRGGTAGGDKKAGLAALAYQTGALPPFSHHYLVDGPIKIGDVNFGAASWHTIAVGGLGKGGTMYYGLDVTQPADITDEASAASKVLWEFTDPNMGYTYGKPMLAKVRAYPDGWVVIVGSGYNNVSGTDAGVGKLFIFDAKTGGTLFKQTLTTGVGSGTTPSGLAHPAGYTKDFRNQTVEQIYAGDLLGNFWRFDVSGDHTVDWKVELMARLVDPAGHAQPVTTPPQIEIDVSNGIDRWVFVGTGKLYDDSDETDLQQQTMYAFRDGTADTQGPIVVGSPVDRFDPGMKKLSQTSTDNFGLGSKPDKGWFDDLPTGAVNGQRIIVPPQAALSIVAYVGTSPQTDSCLTGEVGNVYVRDFSTGQSLLTESDGVTVERSEAIGEGAVGLEIVGLDTASGTSVPDIRVAVTLGTTGAVKFIKPKIPALTAGHRMSWRLLGQ
jgi:type IV pilus assembly protein PilY1